MRACIIGGGLAGSLLAWRLARVAGWKVDLALGARRGADATTASGGAVRAYEREPEQRRLATLSMVELLASPTLRRWADYRRAGFVYVRQSADGVGDELAEITRVIPGWADLASAEELGCQGWSGLPSGAVAVVEREAGYIAPGGLRDGVLSDATSRALSVHQGCAGTISLGGNGLISCVIAGQRRDYDLVVVAAGAWTEAVLRASGLPATGYRTKSIQYAIYLTGGWRPPAFSDELTGLYGRPSGETEVLLGLPTDLWDVDPDRPPETPDLHDAATRLARGRFPMLRIGAATRVVGSSDCYCDQPVLALRPVVNGDHQLFSFTGGAGGSVKTALAASREAAIQLVNSGPNFSSPLSDAEEATYDRR